MRKIAIFIALGALLLLCAAPALANGIPKLPHAFYGSVAVNNAAVSDGTQVSATVNIGDIISTQNPVTTVGSSYGIDSSYLLVQGYDIPDGATITFYVTNASGTAAGGTDTFIAGGGPTRCDLSATIRAPVIVRESVTGAGAGAPPEIVVETDLFGVTGDFSISDTGEILETIEATSEDGNMSITIPEGTIALDINGDPLESLEVDVDESPPPPPAGANIIGVAYDFGPEGATFEPPATLTFTYDPDEIPADTEPVVMEWDADANAWVEVEDYTIENGTITVSVSGFSKYAIFVCEKQRSLYFG